MYCPRPVHFRSCHDTFAGMTVMQLVPFAGVIRVMQCRPAELTTD